MDRYMMKLLACLIVGLACLSAILLTLTVDFDGKGAKTAMPKLSGQTMEL